jgi:hypothetical protein
LAGAVGSLESDRYGHVIGASNLWLLRGSLTKQFESPSSYVYQVKQGKLIGANIAATVMGKSETALRKKERFLMANMGSGHAISYINGWPLFGWLAALLRIAYMLKYLLPHNRATIVRAICQHYYKNLSIIPHKQVRQQYKPGFSFKEVAF